MARKTFEARPYGLCRLLDVGAIFALRPAVGFAWGEYLNKVPGWAALFSWGLSQLAFLGLKPPPPQHYPLSEAQAALQCLADGGVLGKLVLEP